MLSPISYALSYVYREIPSQIINVAFTDLNGYKNVEQNLKDKIINDWVLQDCNLFAGKIIEFSLLQDYLEPVAQVPGSTYLSVSKVSLYRIPPEVRDNLPISSVMNIGFPYRTGAYPPGIYGGSRGGTIGNLASHVLNSHTYANNAPLPVPILLDGDLISLEPKQTMHTDWIIKCRLEYDSELTNINRSAVQPFAELVTTATKAYLYTNMVILIDRAAIIGGMEQGMFREIIMGYQDAINVYQEKLMEFRGAALSDPTRLGVILRHFIK